MMATEQQLREWGDALEWMVAHKKQLREPDLSLALAYEKALASVANG